MAQTMEGRNINLVTISSQEGKLETRESSLLNDSNLGGGSTHCFRKNKMVIMFSARVHPGESPSSHVMDSIIATLLDKSNPSGQQLLRHFVFKCIPMINPDGVYHGHYRVDRLA